MDQTAATVSDQTMLELYRGAGDALEREAARKLISAALFPDLELPGAAVGRFLLRRRLGAGGMGVVFAAHDPRLKRDVAVKVVRNPENEHLREWPLLREAQSAAQLVHPAVVTVYDVGLHEGRVFIAMELVDGQSMSEWLEQKRPPWKVAVAVLARAARGVEAAHARGIVHRDFKPANVLLGRDGRVCVADFGLAREVGSSARVDLSTASIAGSWPHPLSAIAGTPEYMAPEQYLGTAQDERTDQFAFCVSLYEAIWGRRPFSGETPAALTEAILKAEPTLTSRPDVPEALVRAISRGLSKSRRDRFPNMGELAALLEATTADVVLSLDDGPVSVGGPASVSMYGQYLRLLPEGLDTNPEHRVPSQTTRLALLQRPLSNPPSDLVPVVASVHSENMISAVHSRAVLNAIYDEHFRSLEDWREFMGEVALTMLRLIFVTFAMPSAGSPYFIQSLVSQYNKIVRGMQLSIVREQQWSATLAIDHPSETFNEVIRVTIAEVVRAGLRSAGCRVAEVDVIDRASARFTLEARWR